MYTLYKFHFLNGISEINQLFDDILIIWPAPVYIHTHTHTHTIYIQSNFQNKKTNIIYSVFRMYYLHFNKAVTYNTFWQLPTTYNLIVLTVNIVLVFNSNVYLYLYSLGVVFRAHVSRQTFNLHLIDTTKLALSQFLPVTFKLIFFKMSKSLQVAISERILYTGISCCHFVFQSQEMKTLPFDMLFLAHRNQVKETHIKHKALLVLVGGVRALIIRIEM